MGLVYRRSIKAGKRNRVNFSKSGVSVSRKMGPITVNSRGGISIRLFKGLSYRIGRR